VRPSAVPAPGDGGRGPADRAARRPPGAPVPGRMRAVTTERDPLPRTLTALTVLSGVADAVSYLGLGHVFTANMTGNIVLLGFAAARWPGFSTLGSLTSLGAFLVGALIAGRMTASVGDRRHWMLGTLGVETLLPAVAAVIAFVRGDFSAPGARYTVIALLAFAMGMRNSTVRRLAVPDMTTTVLTMTLTGLAADSTLAKGGNPRVGRRAGAVVCMAVGAFVGATMMRHVNIGWPLLVWSLGAASTAALYWHASRHTPPASPAVAQPARP
jgi:uncharacterized membrane protein YoaK (UPF0700 family)